MNLETYRKRFKAALNRKIEQWSSPETIESDATSIVEQTRNNLILTTLGIEKDGWHGYRFTSRPDSPIRDKFKNDVNQLVPAVLEKLLGKDTIEFSEKELASFKKFYQAAFKEAMREQIYEVAAQDAKERLQKLQDQFAEEQDGNEQQNT